MRGDGGSSSSDGPSLANIAGSLPGRFGGRVRHFARVDSTNERARELGRAGEPDGAVVLADEQTAGRGRQRRSWASPAGQGVYVSVLLRPPFAVAEAGPAVQLAAGIAVAEALAGILPSPPLLRWPNDCYAGERKIAGVLVEAETTGGGGFDFLVCGIGINVNQRAGDFPEALRDRATSIRLQVGHEVSRREALAAFLAAFDIWEGVWRRHGLGPIRERWLELSPETTGGEVCVQTASGTLEGTADGLSAAGRLRVRAAGVLHEIAVGELIRLRPA
jgi:BirA family biotin operon repressor/biotin-[acetyl-CoA-carboxylase] ligase